MISHSDSDSESLKQPTIAIWLNESISSIFISIFICCFWFSRFLRQTFHLNSALLFHFQFSIIRFIQNRNHFYLQNKRKQKKNIYKNQRRNKLAKRKSSKFVWTKKKSSSKFQWNQPNSKHTIFVRKKYTDQ